MRRPRRVAAPFVEAWPEVDLVGVLGNHVEISHEREALLPIQIKYRETRKLPEIPLTTERSSIRVPIQAFEAAVSLIEDNRCRRAIGEEMLPNVADAARALSRASLRPSFLGRFAALCFAALVCEVRVRPPCARSPCVPCELALRGRDLTREFIEGTCLRAFLAWRARSCAFERGECASRFASLASA